MGRVDISHSTELYKLKAHGLSTILSELRSGLLGLHEASYKAACESFFIFSCMYRKHGVIDKAVDPQHLPLRSDA